jgi:hypothetical protein
MVISYDLFVQNLFELLLSGNEDIFEILNAENAPNNEVKLESLSLMDPKIN